MIILESFKKHGNVESKTDVRRAAGMTYFYFINKQFHPNPKESAARPIRIALP